MEFGNEGIAKGGKGFEIFDELYRGELKKTDGVTVLAKGKGEKEFPVWWQHQYQGKGAKIICLTLGHSTYSHRNPAYRQMLLRSARELLGVEE